LDRKFRKPRVWSNQELRKVAPLFGGSIVNVSGWKDMDKEGKRYKDYFVNASDYWVTNFKSEARGYQGDLDNELFLDLEQDLDSSLVGRFDVVFNHTVIEHVFNVFKAFENLCLMTRDILIVVVPFLQEQHAEYGDFWRFTPLVIERLCSINKLEVVYINYNNKSSESIYVFVVASNGCSGAQIGYHLEYTT